MYNVFSVAKILCKAGGWQLSNLQLQKILYILQVLHLGINSKPLFQAKFEAWNYGPVVPEVYHRFKLFGNKPVQEWAFPRIDENIPQTDLSFIAEASSALSKLPPFKLVALTHRKGTAWEQNYEPGIWDICIPESDMRQEFFDVWEKKN